MKKIAIIGSGISGLSAAWLLSQGHEVVLYEKDDRLGGHSNTVTVDGQNIDTGFIVYNPPNYPHLTALFEHLGVKTQATTMSFSVSLGSGSLEYAGTSLATLFAQKSNFFKPAFWSMIRDILRFYREASKLLDRNEPDHKTLRDYLSEQNYGKPFIHDHLLPMGAAIWSTPAADMLDYPLLSFVRFCENHGLLQLSDRPEWRTVTGGSRQYVDRIANILGDNIRLNSSVSAVYRSEGGVIVESRDGAVRRFDDVVIATHADQALAILHEPTAIQQKLLGAFQYEKNLAILHTDATYMPRRRKAWASWNYLGGPQRELCDEQLSVTYWMNELQGIKSRMNYFVTLNPAKDPEAGSILRSFPYAHPLFDNAAINAQKKLWDLQGQDNIWFCGSYFGYGFHEDGIQSGLAVAEALGGVLRPWKMDPALSRIHLPRNWTQMKLAAVA